MGVTELRELYEQHRFDEGWALYRSLEAEADSGPEVHYYGARCARGRHDYHGARRAIGHALEGQPSGALLGQIRFTDALMLQEMGEYLSAIEAWQRVIAGMGEYPELAPVMEGPAWNNLGITLRMQRQYDAALDAYHRAAALLRQENSTAHLHIALLNIAWVHCLRGNAVGAREALDEGEPLLRPGELTFKQRLGRAFLAAVEGDYTDALQACEELGQAEEVPLHVRSHAYWVAGRVALSQGILDPAESLIRQALKLGAEARDDDRCLHDSAQLFRELHRVRLAAKQGA